MSRRCPKCIDQYDPQNPACRNCAFGVRAEQERHHAADKDWLEAKRRRTDQLKNNR